MITFVWNSDMINVLKQRHGFGLSCPVIVSDFSEWVSVREAVDDLGHFGSGLLLAQPSPIRFSYCHALKISVRTLWENWNWGTYIVPWRYECISVLHSEMWFWLKILKVLNLFQIFRKQFLSPPIYSFSASPPSLSSSQLSSAAPFYSTYCCCSAALVRNPS